MQNEAFMTPEQLAVEHMCLMAEHGPGSAGTERFVRDHWNDQGWVSRVLFAEYVYILNMDPEQGPSFLHRFSGCPRFVELSGIGRLVREAFESRRNK